MVNTRRAGDFAEGVGAMLEGGRWQDSHMGESRQGEERRHGSYSMLCYMFAAVHLRSHAMLEVSFHLAKFLSKRACSLMVRNQPYVRSYT